MTIAKPSFSLICLAITASNIVTMSRRREARTLLLRAAPARFGAPSR